MLIHLNRHIMASLIDTATDARAELLDAAVHLEGERMRRTAQAVLEREGFDVLVADVLVPTLREIGDRWQSGHLSVLHEHHASKIVRSTVSDMRRRSVDAAAPCVVLACPPGELHDLPSHMFALMLIARGIRPIVLPANTPMAAVAQSVRSTRASASVITARRARSVLAHLSMLERMSVGAEIFLAGPAASSREPLGALSTLTDDWREAAEIVAVCARQKPDDDPRARGVMTEPAA